jgi:hypothetical protein
MNRNIDPARNVDEKQFIQHVLAKLPEGKEGEAGPYQIQRTFINQKIKLMEKAGEVYSLDDLTFDLMEVYNNLHPDSSDLESEDDGKKGKKKKKGETGFAAFSKQPKKKCNNCGGWGHISKFCKGKSSQGSNFVGGRGSGSFGKGRGDQGHGGRGHGSRGPNPHANLACNYCHQKGHIERDSFKLKNKQNVGSNQDHGAVAFMTINEGVACCSLG